MADVEATEEDVASKPVTDDEPKEERPSFIIDVHGLTAKLYLDRPLEIMACDDCIEQTQHVLFKTLRVPWIFRQNEEDRREVDLSGWASDQPFKNTFLALQEAPNFPTKLFEDGGHSQRESLSEKSICAEIDAVMFFIQDLMDHLGFRHPTGEGDAFFYLSPQNVNYNIHYVTSHRERWYDAPRPAGAICLCFSPGVRDGWRLLFPVTVTHERNNPKATLADEIKLMLGELYGNVYYGGYRHADRIPDQETYLFHMHGSKFHILRAWFPGIKSSAVYCGKTELSPRRFTLSTPNPGKLRDDAPFEEEYNHQLAQDEYELAIQQAAEKYRLELGGEPDLKTFRVFASRELDLWDFEDFREAVKHVTSILLHVMDGHSRIGIMERQFYLFDARMNWKDLRREEEAATAAAFVAANPISHDENDDDDNGEGPSSSHHEDVEPIPPTSTREVEMSDQNVETTAEDKISAEVEVSASSSNIDKDGPPTVSPSRLSTKNEAWWKDPRYGLNK